MVYHNTWCKDRYRPSLCHFSSLVNSTWPLIIHNLDVSERVCRNRCVRLIPGTVMWQGILAEDSDMRLWRQVKRRASFILCECCIMSLYHIACPTRVRFTCAHFDPSQYAGISLSGYRSVRVWGRPRMGAGGSLLHFFLYYVFSACFASVLTNHLTYSPM